MKTLLVLFLALVTAFVAAAPMRRPFQKPLKPARVVETTHPVSWKTCYVCIVIDLFSRRVLAHRTASDISSKIVWDTFEEAFELRKKPKGLTFLTKMFFFAATCYFAKKNAMP